jgi:hypothetical protein
VEVCTQVAQAFVARFAVVGEQSDNQTSSATNSVFRQLQRISHQRAWPSSRKAKGCSCASDQQQCVSSGCCDCVFCAFGAQTSSDAPAVFPHRNNTRGEVLPCLIPKLQLSGLGEDHGIAGVGTRTLRIRPASVCHSALSDNPKHRDSLGHAPHQDSSSTTLQLETALLPACSVFHFPESAPIHPCNSRQSC